MERAVQVFAAANFLVIGLSHIFQRDAWIEFFSKLRSLGRLGPFAEGFLYLNFGALIVSLHNVWTFPELVLTLVGWVHVLKALVRFATAYADQNERDHQALADAVAAGTVVAEQGV